MAKRLTDKAIKDILGRALLDKEFRTKLLRNPEKTLTEEGYAPEQTAIDFFKSLKSDTFGKAADKFNKKRDSFERAGEA